MNIRKANMLQKALKNRIGDSGKRTSVKDAGEATDKSKLIASAIMKHRGINYKLQSE